MEQIIAHQGPDMDPQRRKVMTDEQILSQLPTSPGSFKCRPCCFDEKCKRLSSSGNLCNDHICSLFRDCKINIDSSSGVIFVKPEDDMRERVREMPTSTSMESAQNVQPVDRPASPSIPGTNPEPLHQPTAEDSPAERFGTSQNERSDNRDVLSDKPGTHFEGVDDVKNTNNTKNLNEIQDELAKERNNRNATGIATPSSNMSGQTDVETAQTSMPHGRLESPQSPNDEDVNTTPDDVPQRDLRGRGDGLGYNTKRMSDSGEDALKGTEVTDHARSMSQTNEHVGSRISKPCDTGPDSAEICVSPKCDSEDIHDFKTSLINRDIDVTAPKTRDYSNSRLNGVQAGDGPSCCMTASDIVNTNNTKNLNEIQNNRDKQDMIELNPCATNQHVDNTTAKQRTDVHGHSVTDNATAQHHSNTTATNTGVSVIAKCCDRDCTSDLCPTAAASGGIGEYDLDQTEGSRINPEATDQKACKQENEQAGSELRDRPSCCVEATGVTNTNNTRNLNKIQNERAKQDIIELSKCASNQDVNNTTAKQRLE